jgi:hypothetical protein
MRNMKNLDKKAKLALEKLLKENQIETVEVNGEVRYKLKDKKPKENK